MFTSPSLPTGQRIVVTEYGESPEEALERFLVLEPQPPPDVSALGPHEVLVRVEAAQINWVDLLMSSGQYQHQVAPPYTPGLEYAGVVVAHGAAVHEPHLAPGARVFSDGFLTGPRSLGAHQKWGGFAGYALAPAAGLFPVPPGWSFDQAACFLGNYETAYHCLVARGRLCAGETVLIPGASGGTGVAAVHVAKRVGAPVIAVGRSREKLEQVRAAGADHVLVCANNDGAPGVRRFRDEVKALTGGEGADLVYDGVGGELSQECLRCVRFGGRFVLVGWASTPNVSRGKGQRGAPNVNVLPTNIILMKSIDVLGSPTAIATLRDPSIRRERHARLFAWANAGELAPLVSSASPLRDFKTALAAKWQGGVVGSAVLHPWG